MSELFKTCVDFDDPLLRKSALRTLFSAAYMDRLLVVENEDARRVDRLGLQFDLILFDAADDPPDALGHSRGLVDRFPLASLIYVNNRQFRHETMPLINLPREAFAAVFPQLLSLCYIAFLLQRSSFGGRGARARCA